MIKHRVFEVVVTFDGDPEPTLEWVGETLMDGIDGTEFGQFAISVGHLRDEDAERGPDESGTEPASGPLTTKDTRAGTENGRCEGCDREPEPGEVLIRVAGGGRLCADCHADFVRWRANRSGQIGSESGDDDA